MKSQAGEEQTMEESGAITLRDFHTDLKTRRKIDVRLLPILCCLAIITTVDTTNIGATLVAGMGRDLDLSMHKVNIAVSVFFIPLVFLDVPATIFFKASRPSIYLCAVVFLLGAITVCEGITRSYAGFVICRLLLGCCEMAFQVGGVYLIISYYPQRLVHFRVALFLACRLVSGAFGGLLAYGLSYMDGIGMLSGWRWIFIVEGILTCVSGLLLSPFLPDWPEMSSMLSASEKQDFLDTLEQDLGASKPWSRVFVLALREPKVWLGASIHFCCMVASSSTAVWLPTILHDLGWVSTRALYMSIPVSLVAVVFTVSNSVWSDRIGHRYAFCVGPLAFAIVGYGILLAGDRTSTGVRFMACFFLASGVFAALTTSVTWLSNNIHGRKERGVALAIAAGISNCGGILGSNIYLRNEAPRYLTGFGTSLALLVLAIVLATCQYVYLAWENRQSSILVQGEKVKNIL